MNRLICILGVSLMLSFLNATALSADNAVASQMVFVDPYAGSSDNSGTSWNDAVRNIQAGVDIANRFYVQNKRQAYVLIKGSQIDVHTGMHIIMRDGVSIIGSVGGGSAIDCVYDNDGGALSYDGTACTSMDDVYSLYIKKVMSLRDGIASPSAYKTVVSGIMTDGSDYSTDHLSIADGFVVTPSGGDDVSSSAIDVENASVGVKLALRSIIVYGYNKTYADVVRLKNALLYEALIRDNTCSAGYSLSLLDNAYAVSVTVEGGTYGERTLNSLVNYSDTPATQNTFSGYVYPVSDANLNYQLTEGSKNIDSGTSSIDELPTCFQSFIDYSSDRDLLGNPRLLVDVTDGDKVDLGAFETWRIDKAEVSTSSENNLYPHEGSVVYIMDGNSLVLGHDFTPGYLLMKDGASLYSIHYDEATSEFRKYNVNIAYVAVERNVKANGSVVSMPFDMHYTSDVYYPAVDEATGVTTLEHDASSIYTYDGSKRSDWQYSFAKTESACWEAISNDALVRACTGVLYVPNGNHAGKVLRFTCKSDDMSSFVYTESADETYKTILLHRYNDYDAEFTSNENMGWNCIGIPYLISLYPTYYSPRTNIHGTGLAGRYFMDVPHAMWLYYDGKVSPNGNPLKDTDGDGGFYYVSSAVISSSNWHVTNTSLMGVWMGEGFFVQNAKWSGDETLRFFRAYTVTDLRKSDESSAKHSNSRYYCEGSISNGVKATDSADLDINVSVVDRTLFIKNIIGGADIVVFESNGEVEFVDHIDSVVYSRSIDRGVHIVNVNDRAYKVFVE